jgi:short subunit dehydrogenase-like uncharacterized protein
MNTSLLVYGAYGFTGQLIVEHAVEQGLAPIVAGRDGQKTRALATKWGLEARVFSLDDPATVAEALDGVNCVLHAAGPFTVTARPMLEACLARGAHYLDITGEIDVFELAASMDARARAAKVMLLPGVGFDVVPSDCLAAYTAQQVAEPASIHLGILGLGSPSQGTMKTAVAQIERPVRVRRKGQIVARAPGQLYRFFDFGRGSRRTTAVSWGDVATAYYSTGIPEITVYFPARGMEPLLRASQLLGPLLSTGPAQALLKRLVELQPPGPDEKTLADARSFLVAQVESATGERAEARLETPNGYKLTYLAAVDIAGRVLAGEWKVGYQTPSLAYGAEYVLSLPGCRLAFAANDDGDKGAGEVQG